MRRGVERQSISSGLSGGGVVMFRLLGEFKQKVMRSTRYFSAHREHVLKIAAKQANDYLEMEVRSKAVLTEWK